MATAPRQGNAPKPSKTTTAANDALTTAEAFGSILSNIPSEQHQAFVDQVNKQYHTSFSLGNPNDLQGLATFLTSLGSAATNRILSQTEYQGGKQQISPKFLDVTDQKQIVAEQKAAGPAPLMGEVGDAVNLNGHADPYMAQLVRMSQSYAVPWQVLYGVINQESGFNPDFVDSARGRKGIAGLSADSRAAGDASASIGELAKELAGNYAKYHNWAYAALAHDNSAAADVVAGSQGLQHAPGRQQIDATYLAGVADSVGKLPNTVRLQGDFGSVLSNATKQARTPQAQFAAPQMADIRQQVTDEFQTMFLRPPTPQEVDRLSSVVVNVYNSANAADMAQQTGDGTATPLSAPNGPNAVYQALKGSSEYKQLYGKKPASDSEAQYAKTFLDTGHQVLGADANVDAAARAGMATGQAETTAGVASNSGNANENNTFRQLMFSKAALFSKLV